MTMITLPEIFSSPSNSKIIWTRLRCRPQDSAKIAHLQTMEVSVPHLSAVRTSKCTSLSTDIMTTIMITVIYNTSKINKYTYLFSIPKKKKETKGADKVGYRKTTMGAEV